MESRPNNNENSMQFLERDNLHTGEIISISAFSQLTNELSAKNASR